MATRLLLSLEDVSLTFGGKPLFEGLNMHVAERDRICLIGKNGAGKTTLMKLISGDLEVDSGTRFAYPSTSIGYLQQVIDFDPEQSIKEFVLSGLPDDEQTEEHHYRADMVIAPLDLQAEATMKTLSGGQKRRAALAKALVTDPDVLLLDEPTNHLDLTGIEWLEEYLAGYRGTLICISHDRRFLANVSRKVFWIDRGKMKVCPTSYAGFEEWQELQIEQEARELQNLSKKVDAEHGWTQGGVSGRRKRNVRRMRELYRLRDKLKADKALYFQRSQKIAMDALESPNASKIAAEFKFVSHQFTRDDGSTLPILRNFSHTLLKGDRLGVLGKNGSGKSTFLKLLVKELEPDSGNIFRSKTLDVSYFDQNRTAIDPTKTLWETLVPSGGQYVMMGKGEDAKQIHVCGYLKRFLFDPSMANQKVGMLSGGQQNRLLLARTLAAPGNLLILDEPTNDLDMDTLDMLQEMLADYDGTLITVSHDRDFLDRTTTEILAFEGDAEISNVMGGYSDYVREKAGENAAKEKAATQNIVVATKPEEPAKTLTYGEQLELKGLPEKMENLTAKLDEIQEKLDQTGLAQADPEGFQTLIRRFDATQDELTAAEARWLELEELAMQQP